MLNTKLIWLVLVFPILTACLGEDDTSSNEDAEPTESFSISGLVYGLHHDGLVLAHGDEQIELSAGSTEFAFTEQLPEGSDYAIEVVIEPDGHSCTLENSSGVITGLTENIIVNCLDHHVKDDLTRLPVGDNLILYRIDGDLKPETGKLWLCRLPEDGAGATPSDDWLNADGSWNYIIKPQVEGSNHFDSVFNIEVTSTGERVLTGNAYPSTPTGTFPVERGTLAWEYDKNPNAIGSHNVEIRFEANPKENSQPTCVGFGPTGFSLTGSPIYHGSSTLGTDAAAFEMLDQCGGHSDGTNTYHYHFLSDCTLNQLDPDTGGHSSLVGYIMDGFGIYGPRGEDGEILESADLDECHGHTHEINWDGELKEMYHYHWTYDFPYNVGCYKGTPVDTWRVEE